MPLRGGVKWPLVTRLLGLLQLAPMMFGEWALVAEWGRIGSSGKVMRAVFET